MSPGPGSENSSRVRLVWFERVNDLMKSQPVLKVRQKKREETLRAVGPLVGRTRTSTGPRTDLTVFISRALFESVSGEAAEFLRSTSSWKRLL